MARGHPVSWAATSVNDGDHFCWAPLQVPEAPAFSCALCTEEGVSPHRLLLDSRFSDATEPVYFCSQAEGVFTVNTVFHLYQLPLLTGNLSPTHSLRMGTTDNPKSTRCSESLLPSSGWVRWRGLRPAPLECSFPGGSTGPPQTDHQQARHP